MPTMARVGPAAAGLLLPALVFSDGDTALKQCLRNHNRPPYDNPPACFAYFERDSSSTKYCAYPDAPVLTKSKAPAEISCGRTTVDYGSGDSPCTGADTPINEEIRNYMYTDFHVPMYQSSSCCSSVARLGFRYDAVGPQTAQVQNPFSRSPIEVKCEVGRRSVSGDTCPQDFAACEGSDCWSAFHGVGACGLGVFTPPHGSGHGSDQAPLSPLDLYDSEGNLKAAMASAAAVVANMSGVSANTYCTEATVKAQCAARREEWDGFANTDGGGVSCQEVSEGPGKSSCNPATLDFGAKCRMSVGCPRMDAQSAHSEVTPNYGDYYPMPPLDNNQKAGCQNCRAHMRALHAFPCSGRQGEFVQGGEFRICKSTCERLLSACGLPTHRGGIFVQAGFMPRGNGADTTPRFAADYTDATSMCQALWAPHPDSVWAADGIDLVVVDDSSSADECVGFEHMLGSFSFDTQNFIFDYEAIREREGYCSTEDPLYNKTDPCSDLQGEENQAETAERRLAEGSQSGATPMFALDDIARGKMIAGGWPYEGWGTMTLVLAGAGGAALIALLGLAALRCRSSSTGSGNETELQQLS